MNNLPKDISTLTTISKETVKRILDISTSCICDYVLESISDKEKITRIDIGIGKIVIKLCKEDIKFKFIPSKKLCDAISTSVETNINPLSGMAEDLLSKKLLMAYKKLL